MAKRERVSREAEAWEHWVARALRGPHLVEPPDGTLRRALAVAAGAATRRPGLGQRLVELLFDSATEPLPAGVRGDVGRGQRRLLYRIGVTEEAHQLDLRLRRVPRRGIEVTGQVLPPIDRASVRGRAGRTVRRTALGAHGDFTFSGLPASAGHLDLDVVVGDETRFRVPAVPFPE